MEKVEKVGGSNVDYDITHVAVYKHVIIMSLKDAHGFLRIIKPDLESQKLPRSFPDDLS